MGKSDEFIVVNGIFTETSNRYTHSVFVVDILAYLRTVVFCHIADELLRCTRKLCFLRDAFETFQFFDQLLFGWFLFKIDKYGSGMSVKNRYTYTLACDLRKICFYDLSIFNSAENTKRFLLALFFFSTNEWNDIFYHFRPVFKCLSCSGNCLICSSNYFIWLKFFPCSKDRCIALDGAVGLYGNKASCGSQTLLLETVAGSLLFLALPRRIFGGKRLLREAAPDIAQRRASLYLLDAIHALRHVIEHHHEREHTALASELPLELQARVWAQVPLA